MRKRVRSGYPSDVTDDEWLFVAPYLALCREDAAQRDYPLRDVFNGLRYIAKTGSQWRFMPNDLPPWEVVYQQMRRWIDARCFEIMVDDLPILLREFAGRNGQPTAMILDSRTLQSTPESGPAAATMEPSAARDRRCMRLWIRWVISWPCMLRRPTNRTARKWRNWLRQCSRLRVKTSSWPMSIRDTLVSTRHFA